METTAKPQHIGRKISRIRELRGIKQEAVAAELGVTQQTISKMETSETVSDDMLEKVAKVLGVSVEAIRGFNEEAVFNIIANTFNDTSSNNNNYFCTFNPIDKVVELYERLVQSEKDKVQMLEELLKGR